MQSDTLADDLVPLIRETPLCRFRNHVRSIWIRATAHLKSSLSSSQRLVTFQESVLLQRVGVLESEARVLESRVAALTTEREQLKAELAVARTEVEALSAVVARDRARVQAETARYAFENVSAEHPRGG